MWVQLKNKQRGFTIVELLIVIVVIGILASISIVAFSGVRDRAGNAKTLATVKQYRDILTIYKLDNGSYPNISAEYGCLPAVLPATADFDAGACQDYFGTATDMPDGKDLTAMLRTVESSLPDASYGQTIVDYANGSSTEKARAIIYSDDSLPALYYHLRNTASCDIGQKYNSGDTSPNVYCYVQLQ